MSKRQGQEIEEEERVPHAAPRPTEQTLELHPEYEWRMFGRRAVQNSRPGAPVPKSLFPRGWETWDPVVTERDGKSIELATDRFPPGTFTRPEDEAILPTPERETLFRQLNAEVLAHQELLEEKDQAYFPDRFGSMVDEMDVY